MVKEMERFAEKYSADPEEVLPEAGMLETGKTYREKKAKPLIKKIVVVLRSVYRAYLDLSRKFSDMHEYYGAAEPPVRCGESHLSGLTEPPHFVY